MKQTQSATEEQVEVAAAALQDAQAAQAVVGKADREVSDAAWDVEQKELDASKLYVTHASQLENDLLKAKDHFKRKFALTSGQVAESARAHSELVSWEVQKTAQFWLLTFPSDFSPLCSVRKCRSPCFSR